MSTPKPSPAKPAPAKPTSERRRNHSLRNQAQAWFDALRLHITEVDGAEAIAPLIKGWKRPEDVMHEYPALVPLFLDMIWRARKTPGFIDLFRTDSGEVAEEPSEILALSQKSFDDIIIAHLFGTMRLLCERLQNEWVAVEREKRRSNLSKMPVVGATLSGLGLISPPKTEALLIEYPKRGLYEALKPHLHQREQFALVEALSTLPVRTVTLIGPVVGALYSPAAIRNLADLDNITVKAALGMAEAYAQATYGAQHSAEAEADAEATEGEATEGAEAKPALDLTVPTGHALSEMLRSGASFVLMASTNLQLAKDAITRFAPVMGAEMWALIGNAETLGRVAECPRVIAENLQAMTVEIHERVSSALSEIADDRVAAFAMKTLRDDAYSEIFQSWIQDETYLSAWKQLVQNLNRDASVPTVDEPLGPQHKASIKTVCHRGARVFTEIADPEKKAA